MGLILLIASLALLAAAFAIKTSTENKAKESKAILDSKIDYMEKKIEDVKQDVAFKEEALLKHQARLQSIRDEQLSSIRSAKRIQTASFTQESQMRDIFPESFIFTKTHSIVSGDFFKAAQMKSFRIMALADCAGYGVPGGFLSMLGIALLNEQISIHHADDAISLPDMLSSMRASVIQALSSGASSNVNDGMNMTLCAFSNDGSKVFFAGAGQNLYICRGGKTKVIAGDKHPVGWYLKEDLPFAQAEEPLVPGDMVYLTTDSLQNQFGGPQGAKFTQKRIVAMLEEISPKAALEQKQIVETAVCGWVEGHKQIDDLTLLGIRV